MKTIKTISIAVCFLTLIACNKQTEESSRLTQVESKVVVDKWLELWKSYDLNMLDEIFIQSEDLTYFSSEKRGLIKGYAQLKPHHEGFGFVEGGKQAEKSLWLENVETRVYDNSIMVGGIWYFGDKSMPKDSISNGPVTFILIKDSEGLAKIIHTHFANY